MIRCPRLVRLAVCFLAWVGVAGAADRPAPSDGPAAGLAGLAADLVRAYHAGDIDTLRAHLHPDLEFREPSRKRQIDLTGFLESVEEEAGGQQDRKLEIEWTGVSGDHVDVRGKWSWTDAENGRTREWRFSIELLFDLSGERPQVASWLDDFRRRSLWKRTRGDAQLETEHFHIVYYRSELTPQQAKRLGETHERWYETTRKYLGRSFPDGFRLRVDVAGCHVSPYASDPGRDAFFLVPVRSARRDYGFSLVHELTHNLVGLSWLSRHQRVRNGVELYSGNRLFDEGFAVYVEEKLTGEGPRVWPNFGKETHAGFEEQRAEKQVPIAPVLDYEIERQDGDTRFAYLAQASFCKYLVDTHGLDRFLKLFAGDLAAARNIYGKDLAGLERDWRAFLADRTKPTPAVDDGVTQTTTHRDPPRAQALASFGRRGR